MAYSNPIYATYTAPAATISTAAALLTVAGPKGKTGALISISAVVTTASTVAATELRVGTGADADKYGTLAVPVADIGTVVNEAVINPVDGNLIAPDTAVVIATDGGATVGAATITVTIAWF